MTALELTKEFNNTNVSSIAYILKHIGNYYPKQNMHLRDTKQVKGKRKLRFLHITKLLNKSTLIGHISGPNNLEMEYEIEQIGTQVRFTILSYSGNEKDLRRIAKNLVKWLFQRAKMEANNKKDHHSNYKRGEFYLKRSKQGANITNFKVQKGLNQKQFSLSFAKKLHSWGFIILNP